MTWRGLWFPVQALIFAPNQTTLQKCTLIHTYYVFIFTYTTCHEFGWAFKNNDEIDRVHTHSIANFYLCFVSLNACALITTRLIRLVFGWCAGTCVRLYLA